MRLTAKRQPLLLGGGVLAGDKALTNRARQAVHGKAASRFAAAIEARNHRAIHVDHLAARVDAQSGAGVVDPRPRPSPKKRPPGELVTGGRLAKIRIPSGIDE